MPEYILVPSCATFWFCSRVLTRSRGKTHETPMMPAMPPLMILGRRANCWGAGEAITASCCSLTAAMLRLGWRAGWAEQLRDLGSPSPHNRSHRFSGGGP